MKHFAVLQLSGCAGCEVALLDADGWLEQLALVYMPLVVTAHSLPEVDVLLVSGAVRTDEDRYLLRRAVRRAQQVIAVGTCAMSGGVMHLGDRDDVRQLFHEGPDRCHLPALLPKSHPVDAFVTVDRYLPGCPPTPELFLTALGAAPAGERAATVCGECGRHKRKDVRPTSLVRAPGGAIDPELCLINQGYLCLGTSTRGGCRALCTKPGQPCVGCRGPSDAFIEKDAQTWLRAIARVLATMTDVPEEQVQAELRSPALSLFLFQFADYDGVGRASRPKSKVI